MVRVFADLCIKALDRVGYLTTLGRLRILDRLAGPMPERLTDQVIYEDTERLRQVFAEIDFDDHAPSGVRE
jgi:hypothetical protein